MFLSELLAPAGFPLFFQAPGLSAAHGSLRPSLGTPPPPPAQQHSCTSSPGHRLAFHQHPLQPVPSWSHLPPEKSSKVTAVEKASVLLHSVFGLFPTVPVWCIRSNPFFFFSADLIPLKFLMFCIQRPNNGFCLLSKYEAVSHSLCSWLPAPSSPDSLEVECSRHRLLKFPS